MNGQALKAWMWSETAIFVMVSLFACLGFTTAESPMPWTFRLLSDAVIGLWLPLWFYVRMPEGEGMDRIESVARCAVYFVAVAAAGFMASSNLPASHTAVMVGLASLQALARGRKSVADILGVITIVLVAMSAIFA